MKNRHTGQMAIINSHVGFVPTWKLTIQPSVGDPQQYAWTTLGLVPASVINGAIHAPYHPGAITNAPISQDQMARIDGMPLAAGQIQPPSLYDPTAGLGTLSKG